MTNTVRKWFRKLALPAQDRQFIEEMRATLSDGRLTDEERHFLLDRHAELGANGAWNDFKSELYLAAVRGATVSDPRNPRIQQELAEIRRYLHLSADEALDGDTLLHSAIQNSQAHDDQIAAAEAWAARLARLRSLDVPDAQISNVLIRPGERAILNLRGEAFEYKVVGRQYVSGSRGSSIRIAKGFSVRVGGSRGYSQSVMGYEAMSAGRFVITTKRLIFSGSPKSWSDRLEKVIDVQARTAELEYSVEGRVKSRLIKFSQGVRIDEVVAALEGVMSAHAG